MKHNSNQINICLAGVPIQYILRYTGTKSYFEDFICKEHTKEKALTVTDELWERHRNVVDKSLSNEYAEFYALIGISSRELLKYGKCLFHGVAFVWNKKAWIITAPSGTGKTTQYRLWKRIYGDEIELINGDKPIVECKSDGSIWVYPSPWNGKENYSGRASAQLAGIIYLEQAKYNCIERMDIQNLILPIYRQFLFYGDYESEIRAVGKMEEQILSNIPVWKLSNLGDEESVRMSHEIILKFEEDQ